MNLGLHLHVEKSKSEKIDIGVYRLCTHFLLAILNKLFRSHDMYTNCM